jgi:hypothetical protein
MKKAVPFLLLIFLFAAGSWYFFMKTPDPVHEVPPPQIAPVLRATQQQPEPQPETEQVYTMPEQEPEPEPVIPAEPLPELSESDLDLTGDLVDIVGAGSLAEYLVMDQVISRAVASIDSLTSRQVPVHINPVKPADDKFMANAQGDSLIMSAENFSRYDGYVTLLQSVDSDQLTAVYRRYSPLFQQAWEENGGQGLFDERLLEVIDDLLEAPDVPGPVYLTKPEAVYLFEDPDLEAMTAGQKILVRMGSVNAEVVKEKLTQIKAELSH